MFARVRGIGWWCLGGLAAGMVLSGCGSTPEEDVLARADNPCNRSHMRSHAECRNAFVNSVHVGNIKIGQTQDEVRSIMRKGPERREATDQSETWLYHTDYRNRMWTLIAFKEGRVTAIRQFDPRRRR